MDNSSELAEYRLFDSLENFVNNNYYKSNALSVKNDKVTVPDLKGKYITYVRAKRIGLSGPPPKDDGSIFIFHDSSAYAEISPHFFQMIMWRKKGIYIKEQSINAYKDTDKFIVGYHFPHWLSFKYMKPSYNKDRKIDIMYAGKKRKQRDDVYDRIRKSAKKLGLNACLGQSKKQIGSDGKPPDGLFHPKQYVQNLTRSKMAYSFLGTGYRSHRDWEAMLCGAFMLNDQRSLNCCQMRGLKEGVHFVAINHDNIQNQMKYWIEHEEERLEIAKNGFNAAWKIWKGCKDHWQPVRTLASQKIKENGW